ncbi:putative transmembrane protein ORF57 like protein [Argiope bruennichi]|uniref:Chloride channel CLIC-like protein 1 n=1 Tax=Argiope bruennichi TaxID=94029 RepID=A0A8T0F1P9_ARGBR|nr:putative transmembrane protein ORF57 like protein [Argiope bruennichi]
MLYRRISFFIFSCILLLNSVGTEVFEKNSEHDIEAPENLQKPLDLNERKEIAEKYLDKLAQVKENWVDPYDMTGYTIQKWKKPPPELKDEEIKHGDHEDARTESRDAPKIPIEDRNVHIDEPWFWHPPEIDVLEEPYYSTVRRDITDEKMDNPEEARHLIDKKVYIPDKVTFNSDKEIDGRFGEGRQMCILDGIYISRWLKKLVLKIEKNPKLIPSTINFPIDSIVINNLRELANAKSVELSQLDEFMSKMIDQSFVVTMEEFDWNAFADYIKEILRPITIFLVLAICTYSIYLGILRRPIFTVLCFIAVISVFWHWMHLYQQRKAFKLAELSSMTIPAQCRKHELGLIEHFHEYLKSFFASNECNKYYEALTVDPFWEVSITVAISEAVAALLFQPVSVSSRVLNVSIKQLIDGLSIFTLVPILAFVFLLFIMLCNYRIRLPFFMGTLEPNAPPGGSQVQEVRCSKHVKALKEEKISKGEEISTQGTIDGSEKAKHVSCIQNVPEEGRDPDIEVLPGRIGNIKASGSEDNTSITESEDAETDAENSLMEPQNCECCNRSDYDCKVCGNAEMHNAYDELD